MGGWSEKSSEDDASVSSKSTNRFSANSYSVVNVPIERNITKSSYAEKKRIVTRNHE